jgi:hypothetical protein
VPFGVRDEAGALRMRSRCLIDVLRVTDADEDEIGVGGSGQVGGGSGDLTRTGEAGIGYNSVECMLPLLVDILPGAWCSGSSGRGGKTVDGGGFGAPRDIRDMRCTAESRREDLVTGADLGSSGRSPRSGAGGRAVVGAGRWGGTDTLCDVTTPFALAKVPVWPKLALDAFDARLEKVGKPERVLI